jgi:hypothetical protein
LTDYIHYIRSEFATFTANITGKTPQVHVIRRICPQACIFDVWKSKVSIFVKNILDEYKI